MKFKFLFRSALLISYLLICNSCKDDEQDDSTLNLAGRWKIVATLGDPESACDEVPFQDEGTGPTGNYAICRFENGKWIFENDPLDYDLNNAQNTYILDGSNLKLKMYWSDSYGYVDFNASLQYNNSREEFNGSYNTTAKGDDGETHSCNNNIQLIKIQ